MWHALYHLSTDCKYYYFWGGGCFLYFTVNTAQFILLIHGVNHKWNIVLCAITASSRTSLLILRVKIHQQGTEMPAGCSVVSPEVFGSFRWHSCLSIKQQSRRLVAPRMAKHGILHILPQSHFVNLQYHKGSCCAVELVSVVWHIWQREEFVLWRVCRPFNIYVSCAYPAIIIRDHLDDWPNWPQSSWQLEVNDPDNLIWLEVYSRTMSLPTLLLDSGDSSGWTGATSDLPASGCYSSGDVQAGHCCDTQLR